MGLEALPGCNLTLGRLPARVPDGVECPLRASPMTLRLAKHGAHQDKRGLGRKLSHCRKRQDIHGAHDRFRERVRYGRGNPYCCELRVKCSAIGTLPHD